MYLFRGIPVSRGVATFAPANLFTKASIVTEDYAMNMLLRMI